MELRQLLAALPVRTVHGRTDRTVRAIQVDSRAVKQGDLFVAYRGVELDGHAFIREAIERGAVAIVAEWPDAAGAAICDAAAQGATCIQVPSGRAAWALLAAAWHGFPSRQLTVVGVTGTDGKTTTSSAIGSILAAARLRVGLVTTVAAEIAGASIDTGFHTTTPDPPDLQAYLAAMVRQRVDVAVVETTSHALALDKVLAVEYDLAVLTNVTHEHLDFHGTPEAYLAAKSRLFASLATAFRKPGRAKAAVLNAEDRSFERLSGLPYDRLLTYALDAPADVSAREVTLGGHGARFTAVTPVGSFAVTMRLLGRFNVANALAAIGAGIALEIAPTAIADGLAGLRGVPGRLETINHGQPFGVVVDFAHTPNSLRRVLELARSLATRRVRVVFGCAGQRDRAKRPMMGAAAGELANDIYVTAEDPRHEPLAAICAEIAVGVRQAGGEPQLVFDRGTAIAQAIAAAEPGDVVLIAGKGHEQSMCFGDEERPWDDRVAARSALAAAGYPLTERARS